MQRKIYEIYGSDALSMTKQLMEAANVIADIPNGASVALKPNLVVGKPPESGATTHGGILEGIIEYLFDHGVKDVSIMEGAWVGDRTERGFAACGYDKISKKYNVPLYDLKKDATLKVQTPIGEMQVCRRPYEADYLISLPVLKGHCQTVMTCALKNSKGCIPDHEKRRFHTLGLDRPIAALSAAIKPDLYIVDSICGDLNFEEGGTPVETNRMLLCPDPVMTDTYGCRLMGIDPKCVPYIGLAEGWGAGSGDIDERDIFRLNEPKDAPAYARPSGIVKKLTKNVTERSACSACFGNLVHALYRMENELYKPCRLPICIGQEYQGQDVSGIGIGKCCKNAAACAKGCPPSAEEIMRVLLDEME